MVTRLFVGNLPLNISEPELQAHFAQAGVVTNTSVVIDRMTGRSRGFGFVEMGSQEEANKAIALFNQREFKGRALTVKEARPREERPSNGPRPRA